MFGYSLLRRWRSALTLGALATMTLGALPADAAPWDGRRSNFADPRFEKVWRDSLGNGQNGAGQSWIWGPRPWFDYMEVYKQSINGMRQVQYFDKARMEINDPMNTSGPLGGVTNGLLTVEMVSGRVKMGNGTNADENQQRLPALIPVAGDIGPDATIDTLTPTYETFGPIATTDNGYRDQNKKGQRAGMMLTRTGGTSFRSDFAAQPGTELVVYDDVTGHNVPRVFEDFRNASPVPAIVAFGHPISDPYWVQARVGGRVQDVMVQLFERRTLTYTPTNPAAFQIEMGNVGQHYFLWRYNMGTPWVTPDPQLPIVFAGKRNGNSFNIYTQNPSADVAADVFGAPNVDMIPSSVRRTWSDAALLIYGDFVNAQNKRVLMSVAPGARQPNILSLHDVNTYEPAISPDNQQLLFVSDRDGNAEIYLAPNGVSADSAVALTSTDNCSNGHPSWLPDGSGFVYETNCRDGNWNIYHARLAYRVVSDPVVGTIPRGEIVVSQPLTSNAGEDRWPNVSPDGRNIAFMSKRDGNSEIYTVDRDGQRELRLTNNPARDEAPAWGPQGTQLVFNSNRDGDHELFIMGSGGEGLRQLTNNTVDDGYATWWN